VLDGASGEAGAKAGEGGDAIAAHAGRAMAGSGVLVAAAGCSAPRRSCVVPWAEAKTTPTY
jgi:hypothetical protein